MIRAVNSASRTSPKPPATRGRRAPRASGDDRERAILETAERLLADRPLQEISVDDLARGAGISRPSFYFYFPSKDAVLLTLVDRMVAEAYEWRGDAIERFANDPAATVRAAISAFYATFADHRAVILAGAEVRATNAEARQMWGQVTQRWIDEAAAAIEFERARGAAPAGKPARDLATTLIYMNERVLQATLAGESPALADDNVIDVLVSVWLSAIYGSVPAAQQP